jgi:hypothetical protein
MIPLIPSKVISKSAGINGAALVIGSSDLTFDNLYIK